MELTGLLPEDVLLDVLGRLPPVSLVVSRCVCKAWRALVDGYRSHLLPLSLKGIFLELNASLQVTPTAPSYMPTHVLFAGPSTGRKIHIDVGYPNNYYTSDLCDYYECSILDCCNGLLLLRNDRVVNPATRQWVQVPQIPSPCVATDCYWCSCRKYIVFDPTVSPHYELISVPKLSNYLSATGHIGKNHCKDKSVCTMEWPPTPYIMHVFSSRTGEWEDRSFVREGKAAGSLADCESYSFYQGAAYFHGAFYVKSEYGYVLRINLSKNTYQPIKLPKGRYDCRLGKSEKGVYCAYCWADDMFQIWFLDESRGQMEWVLKSEINLAPVPSRPCNIVCGSWMLQEDDCVSEPVPEDNSKWDADGENVVSAEHWVGTYGDAGTYEFLGFHPFKEIALLSSYERVIAYHWNTSKVQDLGCISRGWNQIEASFPYTPCWMGPLPGASKRLIN